jgi:hypothetical protein
MSSFMSHDPWRNVTTHNGIQGDLVISALQKSIRRGLAEEAVTFAYEMYITSPQLEDKLWRRLQAIAVEDVGFGDLSAPVLIHTLNQMRQNFPYTDPSSLSMRFATWLLPRRTGLAITSRTS